jgi:cation diffusion facilitator family transporter
VNWFLLFAKLYCVIISSSKAIAASLADSVVDLLSQGVLALGEHYIKIHSPDYPVGRSRLEALAVLACAGIMSMASVEVIQYSCIDLYSGFSGSIPELEVNDDLYIIMGLGILLKWVLFLFCKYINEEINSDSIGALAEDHLNDVLSNTAAIITAAIAYNTPAWYVDPFGAIVISLVIIGRWMGVMSEQVRKVVGFTASPEFIERVNGLARAHDERLAGIVQLYCSYCRPR